MKNLFVLFLFLFASISFFGCSSYEEDQEIFDQITELEQVEIDLELKSTSGTNQGQDPR